MDNDLRHNEERKEVNTIWGLLNANINYNYDLGREQEEKFQISQQFFDLLYRRLHKAPRSNKSLIANHNSPPFHWKDMQVIYKLHVVLLYKDFYICFKLKLLHPTIISSKSLAAQEFDTKWNLNIINKWYDVTKDISQKFLMEKGQIYPQHRENGSQIPSIHILI